MRYLELTVTLKGDAVSEVYKAVKANEASLGTEALSVLKELESVLYKNLTLEELETLVDGVL